MLPYRYELLPKKGWRYIRLLTLLPGSETDPLHGRLDVVKMKHAQPYEALSYVWGKQKSTTPFLCQVRLVSRSVTITENLEQALHHLRHTDTDRILWIDALCIDQSHLVERSNQVSQMGLIYNQASRVISWVGPGILETKSMFHFVQALVSLSSPTRGFSPDSTSADMLASTSETRSLFQTLDDTCYCSKTITETALTKLDKDSQLTEHIKDLFEREYFKRFWCIQEVLYAQKCDIQCGTEEVDFQDLMALALIVQHWLHNRERSTVQFWIHVARMKASRTIPIKNTWRTDNAPFLGRPIAVMQATRHFQCTDPRDRVYALFYTFQTSVQHPLAEIDPEMSGEGPTIERLVAPNYGRNLYEVYRDFCRACAESSGPQFNGSGKPLEFLSSVQHLDAEAELPPKWPSWVPNFHSGADVLPFQTTLWNAGFTRSGHYEHLPTWPTQNVIQVWGLEVDIVEALTEVLNPAATPNWISDAWSELFPTPLFPRPSFIPQYGRSTMPLATDAAFLLTLAAGRQGGSGDLRVTQHLIHLWLSEINEANILLYSDLIRESEVALSGTDSAKTYFERARDISKRHRCYLTKGGRLGLGPSVMKKGDRLVVLNHGRVPYILRQAKRQGYWRFIGDTYVQDEDLMMGQEMCFTTAGNHFPTLLGLRSLFVDKSPTKKFRLV